jgi:type IV secretion system protein TrbL
VVAFALYQPAAAMVYAAAFLLAPPADSPVVAALTGLTFQAMAIAALPALLRVLRPVVRSATTSGRHRATAVGLPSGARAVSPVRLADSGASGAAATVRVPSTRGGGSGSAAVALPRSSARTGLGVLGVDPLGLHPARGAEPVPVAGAAARREVGPADDRALPGPRIDGEDLVP